MDRTALLRQKAEEIEALLATWAETEGVLQNGEQLLLSLRINKVPTAMCEQAEDTVARKRHPDNITPREVYNAARTILQRDNRCSQGGVIKELNAMPGMCNYFAGCGHGPLLRIAFYAAKNRLPYPAEIDNEDLSWERRKEIAAEVGETRT